MIWFAVDAPRASLIEDYLAVEPLLGDRLHQVTYPELFGSRTLPRGAWIFTSLEALSPAELEMVAVMQRTARDTGMPVFNDAAKALHRYELLKILYDSGINDFRAYRVDGALQSIRFPVFVREADEHHGSLTPLLHNRAHLRRAITYLRLRGFRKRELLVVEFYDTVDPDGLYRKYSIFRVGDSYVPRFLHAGPHWMVKHGTRAADENLIREDLAYVRDNPHAEWVRRVFELARIDYGRLDYSVRKGHPQAWEINFTPVVIGNPSRGPDTVLRQQLRRSTLPAKQIALSALRAAFLRIDPGEIRGDPVQVDFPPNLANSAEREREAIRVIERQRRRIDSIVAAPGLRDVGRFLRRTLCKD